MSQRMTDESVAKSRKMEEQYKAKTENLQLEYNRLMGDVASATQVQGAKIVEKIENLRIF